MSRRTSDRLTLFWQYAPGTDKAQSTAEQDMEIIRNKRATSTAGANNTAGQAKSKYRKRSVSRISCLPFVLKLIVKYLPLIGLDSGPHLLVNVILATSGKRLNGGEAQMVPVPCVMHVGFVCIFFFNDPTLTSNKLSMKITPSLCASATRPIRPAKPPVLI